jgi:hypothetical protein
VWDFAAFNKLCLLCYTSIGFCFSHLFFERNRFMPRGLKTNIIINLTPQERATLTGWQRSYIKIDAGRARRGRTILLVADGMQITQAAILVGISRRFVYKWVKRFLAQRLDGLVDKPGRGFGSRISHHSDMYKNSTRDP